MSVAAILHLFAADRSICCWSSTRRRHIWSRDCNFNSRCIAWSEADSAAVQKRIWLFRKGYGYSVESTSRFKSPHSCSDVCVHVGRVKSRPLTVGGGLRQGSVLSPLVLIVYVHWTNSYSRVDEGVTVGSCKINRLIFADDLVLQY